MFADMIKRTDDKVNPIVVKELRQSTKFMKEYDNKEFVRYLSIISQVIREGQQKGVIREELTPGIMKRALFGMLDELTLYTVFAPGKRKHNLKKIVQEVTDFFIRGLTTR